MRIRFLSCVGLRNNTSHEIVDKAVVEVVASISKSSFMTRLPSASCMSENAYKKNPIKPHLWRFEILNRAFEEVVLGNSKVSWMTIKFSGNAMNVKDK